MFASLQVRLPSAFRFAQNQTAMQENTPLESPPPDIQPKRRTLTNKLFFRLELLLWAVMFVGVFLLFESWGSGGETIVIATTFLLALLYMTVPYLVFGSQGWLQHIGSYGVGFAFAFALMAVVFRIESWAGAIEMCLITFPLAMIQAIAVIILLMIKPSRWHESSFYKHAVVRLALAAWFTYGETVRLFFG